MNIIRRCACFSLFLAAVFPSMAAADIYRFVTVDGVETFTDAPSDKNATVVIKEQPRPSAKRQKTSNKQKTHNISLDEIALKAVLADISRDETPPQSFEPRLPDVGGVITSRVGMRIDPIDGKWRQHNGVDIAIPSGTPIKSVSSGIVVYSGNRSGYGNTVVIEHDNGIITLYAHNSSNLVTAGQMVAQHSIIALAGSTGRSTGPHLHFEAWQSGTNVTEAFLPNSSITLPGKALVASNQSTQRFRSEVLSDGSVLFTNIPSSVP